MATTYFVIDNRNSISHDTFEGEAAAENYSTHVFNMLASYQLISVRNSSWLPPITGVAVTNSPTTSHLLSGSKCDIPTLKVALTRRFEKASPSHQWTYYSDALRKIMNNVPTDIRSFDELGGNSPIVQHHAGVITIVTTDHICADSTETVGACTHSNTVDSTQSPLAVFCSLIHKVILAGFYVRIVCVQLRLSSAAGSSDLEHVDKTRRLQCLFQSIKRECLQMDATHASSSSVTSVIDTHMEQRFSTAIVENNPIYYEDELKHVQQQHVVPLTNCVLKFGGGAEVTMTVSFVIRPVSTDSAAAMHTGLRTPVCFQQVPRSQLHPVCIKGNALMLEPCIQRSQHNRVGYRALSHYLSSRDQLLVLRVHHSEARCDQFWCIIPPAKGTSADSEEPMFLLQLQDSEGIINYAAITATSETQRHHTDHAKALAPTGHSHADGGAELQLFMEATISKSLNTEVSGGGAGGGEQLESGSIMAAAGLRPVVETTSASATSTSSSSFYNPLFAVSNMLQNEVEARVHQGSLCSVSGSGGGGKGGTTGTNRLAEGGSPWGDYPPAPQQPDSRARASGSPRGRPTPSKRPKQTPSLATYVTATAQSTPAAASKPVQQQTSAPVGSIANAGSRSASKSGGHQHQPRMEYPVRPFQQATRNQQTKAKPKPSSNTTAKGSAKRTSKSTEQSRWSNHLTNSSDSNDDIEDFVL